MSKNSVTEKTKKVKTTSANTCVLSSPHPQGTESSVPLASIELIDQLFTDQGYLITSAKINGYTLPRVIVWGRG